MVKRILYSHQRINYSFFIFLKNNLTTLSDILFSFGIDKKKEFIRVIYIPVKLSLQIAHSLLSAPSKL